MPLYHLLPRRNSEFKSSMATLLPRSLSLLTVLPSLPTKKCGRDAISVIVGPGPSAGFNRVWTLGRHENI
jgi:hypothetical protein